MIYVVYPSGRKFRARSLKAAEQRIAKRQKIDPVGVERGDYSIDAPELTVNPPRKRAKRLGDKPCI